MAPCAIVAHRLSGFVFYCETAKLQSCETAKLRNCETAKLQNCADAGAHAASSMRARQRYSISAAERKKSPNVEQKERHLAITDKIACVFAPHGIKCPIIGLTVRGAGVTIAEGGGDCITENQTGTKGYGCH
jgi:hypothetical protein